MTNWKIVYDNDTGPNDDGYCEWWDVTDGDKSFRCENKTDAAWLCEILNTEKGA